MTFDQQIYERPTCQRKGCKNKAFLHCLSKMLCGDCFIEYREKTIQRVDDVLGEKL